MAAARPFGALLVVVVVVIVRQAAAAERDALRAFKAGVSDPSGTLQSWNATAHFCRWAGVSCTHGHVTSLELSDLGLTGAISPAIGNLTYLETLDLKDNKLSGSIPASIGRLRRLSYLGLCRNGGVGGEIPDGLRNCTSLAVVYLNGNNLTGAVPEWFGTFPNLTYLWLSGNSLSGEIPPSLGSLSKLRSIMLDQNLLEGAIPEGVSRLPSLEQFAVYQNGLGGEIPRGFFDMPSLRELSLANNAFRGRLPRDAGARTPSLERLLLGGNNLTGPIPASLAMATGVQYLSLANNSFIGRVPPEIGTLCPIVLELSGNELTATDDDGGWEFLHGLTKCSNLTVLSLEGNKLGGTMPSSIGDLSTKLEQLGLGSNRLSGSIPPGIGNLAALQLLRLDSNLLTGDIPEGIGNLKNLTALWLQGNELTGPVPSSIGSLTQLLKLDLSGNALSGSIPTTLANLQQLNLLNLSGNALTGHVPREIFDLPSLSSAMDLSDNQLDGPLPADFSGLVNLAFLTLSGNRFSGEIPRGLENCQSLEFLDLDSNFFDGSIPPSLSKLKGLRRLNLTNNKLSGSIPPELGKMPGLQELYLSRNDLSGKIPEALENASSLIELDLSYNHLDGRVPLDGVFANTTGFKIAGNGDLCGGAAQLGLPRCPAARNTRHRIRLLLLIGIPVLSAALFLAMHLAIFHCCKSKKPGQARPAAPAVLDGESYRRISYSELAKATNGFAAGNLIGAGKFGSVYLGTLPLKVNGASAAHENAAVAVKVFDLRQVGASKTFVSECEALRRVRHRNLIRVVTCCASVDARGDEFRALVFEFMPNYSLDRWLHPRSEELNNVNGLSVIQRLNIAVDIAGALEYLHGSCVPPIVHCDLKPSNVLLGEDMTALIGDFGLAKLLVEPGSRDAGGGESTIGVRGTIGYVAPEYGTTGRVSTHGDVYSFGVTLLEILTGRSPAGGAFGDGTMTLQEFVGAAFPDRVEQVVDPGLLLLPPVKGLDGGEAPCGFGCSGGARDASVAAAVRDCLVAAVRVGLSCARGAPCERPSVTEAAAELRAIRDACARSLGES
ncbi:hypothetical protein ACP70R_043489 [Stipagrostis hirtigluma subsp. patula]